MALGTMYPIDLCEVKRRVDNARLYGIDDEEVRDLNDKIRKKYGMNDEEVMASMVISAPDTHAFYSYVALGIDNAKGIGCAAYTVKLLLVLQEFDESFMDQLVGGHVAACLWP